MKRVAMGSFLALPGDCDVRETDGDDMACRSGMAEIEHRLCVCGGLAADTFTCAAIEDLGGGW
jgi:hypothetical protein